MLATFNRHLGKCIFSLEDIKKGIFGSEELKLAIRLGYKVTRIYRGDRYKSARSKWFGGPLGVFILMKMMNSSKMTTNVAEQGRCKEYYRKEFDLDIDFSDPSKWDKRDAAKKTAKIFCNSAWGKQAESVDHEECMIIDPDDKAFQKNNQSLFDAFDAGVRQMTGYAPLPNNRMLIHHKPNREKEDPNLRNQYVPCATFVTMYARMMLYNELDKFKERVIMMDTDSIKVMMQPGDLEKMDIGNYLGQWEDEAKGDPSCEFVATGLKSYSVKHESGKTETKVKGVHLKRAHQKIINHEEMKKILFEGKKVLVPQMVFANKFGRGMKKRNFLKKVEFNAEDQKGIYDPETFRLYPFGWEGS